MSALQIEPRHLRIVHAILGSKKTEVMAFGSRAKGTARKFSDLDLVFVSEIDRRELAKLRNAFEDSDLPYKVDLAVWTELDPTFQKHIAGDLKPVG